MMLNYKIYDNTLYYWVLAFAITVGVYAITRITKAILARQLGKHLSTDQNSWTANALKVVNRISSLFLLVAAIYAGSLALKLTAGTVKTMEHILFIAMLIQVGRITTQVIDASIENYRTAQLARNAAASTMLGSASLLLRILLWAMLLILALDNFGVNVTALVAGLGVGGVAVALAVQNILGDVFASFSIVLDKPFVIGDFIIVDDHLGTVEHVGLKTTRIRSLSGEQLVFSNVDLLKSRIRNFKRMYERRVVFSIGVVYQTPVDKVAAIPDMIRQIIQSQEPVRFDRAHFKEYGPYALNYEIVYWVLNPDYNIYMDIQQAINIGIYEAFEQAGIEFAYPTQLLYMQNQKSEDPGPEPPLQEQSTPRENETVET